MASDWFGPFTRLVKGQKARADAVNSLFDQVETGLDKLPTENQLNRGTRNYAANTGAANAYAATFSHISTSYATGQEVEILIDAADINTAAACTLNISGIGAISIKYPGGSNPAIGDLVGTCKFRYSGTVWHFMSTAVNQPAYAEEWATKAEDSLISTAAGGNGSTDYSSLHHAAKASASASSASSSASTATTKASEAASSASTAAASADMVEQFKATEAVTPDMTALIKAGKLMYGGTLASQAQQTTSTITAPTTNPRIDRIVIDEQTGAYSIVTGTEAASPSAPAIPTGKLPVCQFQLETTTTAITNSMITDERIVHRNSFSDLQVNTVDVFAAFCSFTVAATPVVTDSKNIASVTNVNTGIYEVTMSNAMANTTYGVIATVENDVSVNGAVVLNVDYSATDKTTTVFTIVLFGISAAALTDAPEKVTLQVVGKLA